MGFSRIGPHGRTRSPHVGGCPPSWRCIVLRPREFAHVGLDETREHRLNQGLFRGDMVEHAALAQLGFARHRAQGQTPHAITQDHARGSGEDAIRGWCGAVWSCHRRSTCQALCRRSCPCACASWPHVCAHRSTEEEPRDEAQHRQGRHRFTPGYLPMVMVHRADASRSPWKPGQLT